mgnify:CR=1 FL=1
MPAVSKPLGDYEKKRDFERTPEPPAERPRRKSGAPPIFVVHRHEARRLHYNYVGSEHLLLGLLMEEKGAASLVLRGMGLTAASFRASMLAMRVEATEADASPQVSEWEVCWPGTTFSVEGQPPARYRPKKKEAQVKKQVLVVTGVHAVASPGSPRIFVLTFGAAEVSESDMRPLGGTTVPEEAAVAVETAQKRVRDTPAAEMGEGDGAVGSPPATEKPSDNAAYRFAYQGLREPAKVTGQGVIWKMMPSRADPDSWVVEAVNCGSEGEISAVVFHGSRAKERATEYFRAVQLQEAGVVLTHTELKFLHLYDRLKKTMNAPGNADMIAAARLAWEMATFQQLNPEPLRR